MARIRSLKPDAFKSESLSKVPRGTRWTFAGLWTYLDDAGRGKDNARLIWAELYPLDEVVTVKDVEHDLALLESIGAVVRYEVDGQKYIAIPAFDKHQAAAYRRSESHLPDPTESDLHTSSRKDVQMSAGREGKGEGDGKEMEVEQGMRAARTQTAPRKRVASKADEPSEFVEFYEHAYPRKESRPSALKAWIKAVKKLPADQLIASAREYAVWVASEIERGETEMKYVPHPATWLNGERWNDEPPVRQERRTNLQQHLELVRELGDDPTTTLRQIGPA